MTKIEWTDASWNPIRARNRATGKIGWHCEHKTTGCEHCYAEGINKRLGTGLPFKPGLARRSEKGDVFPAIEIFLDEQMLLAPLHWKKPRKIFVGSMTDPFADFVSDAMLDRIFAVAALCPQHTLQVLTKRADRMRKYFEERRRHFGRASDELMNINTPQGEDEIQSAADALDLSDMPNGQPLPNVWLGVSAERQEETDERIPHLLQTPAAVRFVSCEPLLGHIALHALNLGTERPSNALRGVQCVPDDSPEGYHNEQIEKLDWVIAGGESGPRARPMHPDWARDLRNQCQAAAVPFFFKQWGEWAPSTSEHSANNPHSGWQAKAAHPHVAKAEELYPEAGAAFIARVGKRAAGRLLDGVIHDAMPERA